MPHLIVTFRSIDETDRRVLQSSLRLPVVINDFQFTEEATWSTYSTVSSGDYSVPAAGGRAARQQRRIDLNLLTVDFDAPFSYGDRTQAEVRAELFDVLRYKTPFELDATQFPDPGYEELVMDAKLLSIARRLTPGQANVRYFDLSLEEWRRPSLHARSHSSSRSRRRGVKLPTTHKLGVSDSLGVLSVIYYGGFGGWRTIAEANGVRRWGRDVPLVEMQRFKPGDKVKIPKRPPIATLGQTPPRVTGSSPQETT